MKKTLLILLFAFVGFSGFAQEKSFTTNNPGFINNQPISCLNFESGDYSWLEMDTIPSYKMYMQKDKDVERKLRIHFPVRNNEPLLSNSSEFEVLSGVVKNLYMNRGILYLEVNVENYSRASFLLVFKLSEEDQEEFLKFQKDLFTVK